MSKITIGQKIRFLREAEGMGRNRFAKLVGKTPSSLTTTETTALSCNSELLETICNIFPQYSLWLMTNKSNLKVPQKEPDPIAAKEFREQRPTEKSKQL